jgi:sec-independent protein translocase protein TatA
MGDALAPWHIIILLVVLVVLFGSRRLPGAAKSIGESMHIFKRSVSGLSDDHDTAANPSGQPMNGTLQSPVPAVAPLAAPAADGTQQQLADMQRQIAELQRQNAASNGQAEQTQTPQPL